MSTQEDTVPEGYMKNSQGHLVPLAQVKEVDKIRDYLVSKLVKDAKIIADNTEKFKGICYEHIASFISLAAQEHGVEIGGDKGNVTLTSFDGRFRICRANDDMIEFNESITIARELIFELIKQWSEGSNANIVAIVHKAFETDKNGHLSVAKILSLKSVQIEDAQWKKAMDIIGASIQVWQTKTYIRFYEKDANGKFVQVALGN
jgi:hypothetical protein